MCVTAALAARHCLVGGRRRHCSAADLIIY